MNIKYVLPIVLLVAIGGAIAFYVSGEAGAARFIVAPVKRMNLLVRVKGSGRLEAAESLRITAPLWWKPITWLIPEGTMVKKDELIVKFEKKDLENEVRTARADMAVFEAQLEEAKKQLDATKEEMAATIKSYEADLAIANLELKRLRELPRPDDVRRKEAELRRAKAEFEVAKEEYERMAQFSGQGLMADTDLRQMMSKMKEAEAFYIRAQTALRVTKAGAHPDEVKEAELRLEQARIALHQAQDGLPDVIKQLEAAVGKQAAQAEKAQNVLERKEKDLNSTELTAPVDGMVVYRTVDQKKIAKGVKMWKGCAIMDLPDLSKMIVKTKIREDHIHLVEVGQKVKVYIDALPEKEFSGKVTEVGKIAKDKAEGEILGWGQEKQESGIKVFDVTVAIEESDSRLVPNLITRLEILVDELKGVLVIPTDAVEEKDDQQFVWVAAGKKREKRPVTLGPETEDLVVVESGLKEGEPVCLSEEQRGPKPTEETAPEEPATP